MYNMEKNEQCPPAPLRISTNKERIENSSKCSSFNVPNSSCKSVISRTRAVVLSNF